MLPSGFEPESRPREGRVIGRTTPRERRNIGTRLILAYWRTEAGGLIGRSTAPRTVARGLSVDSPRRTRRAFGRSRVGIPDFEGRLTAARDRRQLMAADHYQSSGMPPTKKLVWCSECRLPPRPRWGGESALVFF